MCLSPGASEHGNVRPGLQLETVADPEYFTGMGEGGGSVDPEVVVLTPRSFTIHVSFKNYSNNSTSKMKQFHKFIT